MSRAEDTSRRLVEHLEALPRVQRKGTTARPSWYVDDRLIARAETADRWIVRCDFATRESLLEDPVTFGVRPQFEAHQKVEVYLDEGDPDAIERALDAAWEMQRKR